MCGVLGAGELCDEEVPSCLVSEGLVTGGAGLVSDGGGLVSDGGGLVSDGEGLVSDGGGLVSDGGGLVSDGGGLVSDGVSTPGNCKPSGFSWVLHLKHIANILRNSK